MSGSHLHVSSSFIITVIISIDNGSRL